MSVTDTHEEKLTLSIDVNVPGHEARVTTKLFTQSKKELMVRVGGRCWVCGRTSEEAGPLEAHHHPIERSLANMIDWDAFRTDCEAGIWGPYAAQFDWESFDPVNDPYKFVDDMRVNGLMVCKEHHTGKDAGIHAMPYPLWIAQRYGKEGYQFTPTEIIHHEG